MRHIITIILTTLALSGLLRASESQTVMERDGVAEIGSTLTLSTSSTETLMTSAIQMFGPSGPLVIWFPEAMIYKSGSTGGSGDKMTVLNTGNVHFQGVILGGGEAHWSSSPAINPHARELLGTTWTANGTTFATTGNFTERGEQLSRWRGSATSDPSNPEGGDMYWNSGNSTLRIFNGTNWINLN